MKENKFGHEIHSATAPDAGVRIGSKRVKRRYLAQYDSKYVAAATRTFESWQKSKAMGET